MLLRGAHSDRVPADSPAFVRTNAASSPIYALRILAELYRQARALWPLSAASAGKTVTVRIDQLKDREGGSVEGGHAFGDGWLLLKRNEMEAVVEEQLHHGADAPDSDEVAHVIFPEGFNICEEGDAFANRRKIVDAQLDFGGIGDGKEVQN